MECSVPTNWPSESARHSGVRTTSICPSPKMSPDRALGVVLGVLGLIGAAGLWMLKRWALWLTTVVCVCVLNILSAAPGLAFAPTPTQRALATVGVVGFALVILLVVLPNSRRAYT